MASSVIAPLAIAVCTAAQETPKTGADLAAAVGRIAAVQEDAPLLAVELGQRHERRQPIARRLVVRLADSHDRFEPTVAEDGAQALAAVEPTSTRGPGLAVRIAADSARRATAKGCSPAST